MISGTTVLQTVSARRLGKGFQRPSALLHSILRCQRVQTFAESDELTKRGLLYREFNSRLKQGMTSHNCISSYLIHNHIIHLANAFDLGNWTHQSWRVQPGICGIHGQVHVVCLGCFIWQNGGSFGQVWALKPPGCCTFIGVCCNLSRIRISMHTVINQISHIKGLWS